MNDKVQYRDFDWQRNETKAGESVARLVALLTDAQKEARRVDHALGAVRGAFFSSLAEQISGQLEQLELQMGESFPTTRSPAAPGYACALCPRVRVPGNEYCLHHIAERAREGK